MWGIVVLMFAWGSVGTLSEPNHSVMGRLSWCSTLCMCETDTNTEVQCFEEDDVYYQLLSYTTRQVSRLKRVNWSLESNVHWCNDLCLCHIQSGKDYKCTEPEQLTQLIINKIGSTYFLPPEGDGELKQEEERSVDEDEDPSLDQEMTQRKRPDHRRNKKIRKQKKNKKAKHKSHSEESQQPDSQPEAQAEPEADVYTPSISLTPTSPADTPSPTPENFSHHHPEAEVIDHELLPKQEAVAANPAVTALQPPSRKLQPYSTAESYTPRGAAREAEGLSPRVQPVVEVPKEKKTVASMVSQDLDDLGTTVRNIKNDVMLNQRILLVTVAIAGVAMLGVLILAILGCTNRRQNQAAKKRDSSKDGNHSPKVNLQEAW